MFNTSNNPKPLAGTITPGYDRIEVETNEKPISEIEQEINMLSACLESLERALVRLESKTQYIVSPATPMPTESVSKTQSRSSGLGITLQQLSSKFNSRIESFEDIVRRIQL